MDDKNVQEMNALEEAAFNDPVKFLNEQHAPRTWTLSTVDLAKTAAVSPYEIMATSEERWGPEKASIASTAVREFMRGFSGMADSTVNGIMEDRAKEIIYRSPNMRQKDANRLIEDVMRSGSLARQVENYEASKTAHDNFTAGISNGLGSMVSLALLGWASKSPAAVGVAAGLGEAYNAREEMVDRYIQEMGTAEGLAGQLGKYNALATGYGAFAGFVEGSIGVERLAAGALNRYGRLAAMERLARQQGKFGKALAYKTGRQVVATGLEEGGEEFLQSIGQDISVSLTRDMWENPDIKKALIQAGYGALIGSTSGGIMYNVGRKRAIDFIRNWNDQTGAGLTESQIVQAADGILDDVTQTTVDEVATRAELQNQYGQMYETLKSRIREVITATGTTPWTDQNKSMEDYIDLVARTLSVPAVLQANGLGIPTSEFLEVADMVVQDNVLQLVPLNDIAELQDIIARQNAILAQQREAKKLGMGDDSARRSAEQRKAIAEKALRYMREEEKARKQLVEAKRKSNLARLGYDEIDQAAKDVKYLKGANSLEEFKAKLPSGTTDEQAKNRFESALMNWIAGDDKRLAEDFILERGPMQKAVDILTANGKTIYDVATKHPGAGLREDIANALRKMRHANKDNFLMITQSLPRDGHDVMPENILLWNWLFADPATNNQFLTNYATKLAENREQIADGQALFGQKVAPLSKKDLIMQALQDTDQAKAQLAESRGRKYEPLFDKNGAVKDPYLAAAIVSYQNQFAPRFNRQMPRLFQEQFDLANENARLDEIYPEYTGDTIEVDGKIRTVYNSEGQRINKSAEALTNFWRWFGDSKVVDEQDRPLVVYHGTGVRFEEFDNVFGRRGLFFTSSEIVAQSYQGINGGREKITMPVYLKAENPFVIDFGGSNYVDVPQVVENQKFDTLDDVGYWAKQQGYDGVIAKNIKDPASTSASWEALRTVANDYVVFEPTQIKSVNNLGYYNVQDPRMLYQIGYASMRGELVGDYIDANMFAHTGEGPNVHGWGNYFLADKEIDKKRYFERFQTEGPSLKYDGQEINSRMLDRLGITYPETQNIIKYRIEDLGVTKKWVLDALGRELKTNEDRYNASIENAISEVKDSVGEEKARKIIADIEKMLPLKGGSFISLVVPLNPVAYPEVHKIQKKYFKDGKGLIKDGKLTEFTDDFVEVYDALIAAFGGGTSPETTFASTFAREFADLQRQKKSLEAVKKLDFDKFTGRTGLIYKGEDFRDWFTGKLRIAESRHGKWVADAAMHWAINTAQEAVEDSFKFNADIMENIAKEEEKSVLPWTRLIPEVKQKIASNIEKFKDRQPNADVKAVKKFLFDFIESPNREVWPSDGLIYQDWYKDESTLADRDLIDLVVSDTEHGIDYPEKNPDDLDSIMGLMNSIRAANALKRSLDETKSILKNVKKEDLVFKPRASMYKTDKIPENAELLDFSKHLNKQPQKVQQAIRKFVAENQENIWWLPEILEVGFADNTTDIFPEYALSDLFDLDIDPKTNVSPKILSIADMMESDRYMGKPDAVRKRMVGLATDSAVASMLKHPDRQVTIDDIAREVDVLKKQGDVWGTGLNLTESEKQTNKDFDKIADWLKKGLYAYGRKGTEPANTISKWFDVSRVELRPTNAASFFDRLQNWLYAHPATVETYKKDKSLNLTKDADAAELTAKLLLKQGIRGNRYWGKTDKRGFVTFEPTPVTERLYQNRAGVLAVYDPELQAIILGKNWNELSLVHEFHHRYLEKVWNYFKQAQAGMRGVSKAWLDDTQRLFNMLEIDPNQGTLTTVQQEKFAYMVEAYLTGLGVENQDNLAFQGFLHWIPERYRSIMDLGYLDANNEIQNPMLDEESVAFFNKWFASPLVPSLPSAPDAQRIVNASDEDGEILPSNQKVMNNREKEWGQDSEIQNKADAQLWRGIGENTPSDMRASMDGEKEIMKVATNNMPDDRMLPTPPKQTLREKWFKTHQPDARELAAEAARKYVAANPDRARELAFADPETMVSYDAPVDHGMLIRAVMETVGKGSDEWYILDNNLATVKSMSGSTLALSGDLSHQAYLDAKREIESARELKAIVNYAGTGRGATEKWNGDIRAFAARRTAAILATEPNSEERKVAIKAFLEEAKTKFSGNTTNAVLNQLDLTGYQTKDRQVFVKWAEKQIKSVSHARLDAKEQAELMKASVAAQLALRDIDSKDLKDGQYVRAVQSAKDIRHWQFVKDKMKKAYIGRWGKFGIFWDNLLGSYAPSAMLMSTNTLFFANVPSTALNTATIRLAALSIGDNKVDNNVQKGEIKRIKQIFNASGVNIAQMDKPTSPSTLHGEKYTNQEQKHWYNFTFDILGREDNVFRVPTFVDALARIATKNANGDAKKATALFNEYTKLNTTDEDAKIARKQALAVANMAVFTQDGIMAGALNHIRSALNTISRGAFGLDPKGFGLGNILAPFLKTGANITEMGLSATLALPRTAIAIAQNQMLGKEIPDIRRLTLISDWINLAWMSVVIALLAAINADDDDWYTEPYESGKRYDPDKPYDSVNFGGVWVKLDIFGPMAIPLRTALKVVKEWEKKKLAAVADGLMFGGMEALSDTPLVNQVTDNSLDYMARQPESYWTGFGYNQLNKLVPAQIKTATRAGSRATGTTVDVSWAGKTLERKFHRNYGLDGERLTTNDIISIFTNRLKYKPQQ